MAERSDPTTGELLSTGEHLLRESRELLRSIGERLGDEDGSVTVEQDDED